MDIAQIRREYTQRSLNKAQVDADPIKQFGQWLGEAQSAELPEPTAMALATVSARGEPSVRIVLLKGVDESGFVFYTNYDSAKGADIAGNSSVSMVFFWKELERQVRIRGAAVKLDQASSRAYFASRPRGSQLGALASQQSRPVANRTVLEQHFAELEDRYRDAEIPMPEYWGGYRVAPNSIEFWQGRASRLHDRLLYQRQEDQWRIIRLQP